MTTLLIAGKIYLENGDIQPALWEIEGEIRICDQNGHPVVVLQEKDIRAVLTAYCESTPKTNDKKTQ